MGNSKTREYHIKLSNIIRCYLLLNKGKDCTANEIARWISFNGFAFRDGVSSHNVSNEIRRNNKGDRLLQDVIVTDRTNNSPKKYRIDPV